MAGPDSSKLLRVALARAQEQTARADRLERALQHKEAELLALREQLSVLLGGAGEPDRRRVLAALGETLGITTEALEGGRLSRALIAFMQFVEERRKVEGYPKGPCLCDLCHLETHLWHLTGGAAFHHSTFRPRRFLP